MPVIRLKAEDPKTVPASPAFVRILQPSPGKWFDVGDLVAIQANFSDPSSTTPPVDTVSGYSLVQPTNAECLVVLPDGTEVQPDVETVGTLIQALLSITQSGTHWFRFLTPSGQWQGVAESFFQVHAQQTVPGSGSGGTDTQDSLGSTSLGDLPLG